MNFKNSNPYFVSEAYIFDSIDFPLSELFTMEVNQETGIGTIHQHTIWELPNRYQNREGHSEVEYLTKCFFYDDITIIDSKDEIPELIELCQQYINNPVKFEQL